MPIMIFSPVSNSSHHPLQLATIITVIKLFQVNDILLASSKFTKIAKSFNNSFDVTVPALELLSYHEYNDQLLELERSFLLPPSTSGSKPFYLKPR